MFRLKRLRSSERGQSLVEFAMVLPLLLVVAFIITEFGRALWMQNVLTEAAGNATRAAIVSSAATYQQVAEVAANRILDASNMGTSASQGACTVTSTLEDVGGGDFVVRVRVTRDFSFIPGGGGGGLPTTPFAGSANKIALGTFTIGGESVMKTQPSFN
jgi:Flp pilus assembly protein TadG